MNKKYHCTFISQNFKKIRLLCKNINIRRIFNLLFFQHSR